MGHYFLDTQYFRINEQAMIVVVKAGKFLYVASKIPIVCSISKWHKTKTFRITESFKK